MSKPIVALENIRSLHNIGAIFRTCSFFGVEKVLLVGYSGKMTDFQGGKKLNPKVSKTALGSDKDLDISLLEDSSALIDYAKFQKLSLVSVEQHKDSIALKEWVPKNNCILVFGHEVNGVSENILKASDQILEINRLGTHYSLNVTTACGIVLYRAFS